MTVTLDILTSTDTWDQRETGTGGWTQGYRLLINVPASTHPALTRGCVCVYQSAEWALVKGLTGTDLVALP